MTEYFVIITLSVPMAGGAKQGTFTATLQIGPDATEAEIYEHVRAQIPGEFQGATVLFYDARPNRATGRPEGGAS